jgi:hypothetical protein
MIIKTKDALAERLDISRPTLDKYLSLSGAPKKIPGKGYDWEAVLKFVGEHAESDAVSAKSSEDIKSLKAKEIALRCERMRFGIDREKKKFVPRVDVAASIRRCLGPMASILEQKLANEYPSAVAGLDVPQARVYGKRVCDEILKCFEEFEREWAT